MLGCTNDWHKHLDTDTSYCTSCGERADEKLTLANCPMGVGAMSGRLFLLRHFDTGEVRRGRVVGLDGQGMRFMRDPRGNGGVFWITAEESYDWELWSLLAVRADEVPLDQEFCYLDKVYRRVSFCSRTSGTVSGTEQQSIYTANKRDCNIAMLAVGSPVFYPLPEPWLSGDPADDAA